MTMPQPRRQLTARAGFCPWLLVWLVPWLFLSVASGGLHDHDLHGLGLHQDKTCITQSGNEKSGAQSQLHAAAHNAAHHDCQACRWSAQSASVFAFSSGLSEPVSQPESVQPQTCIAPSSPALPALRGRGPPSF